MTVTADACKDLVDNDDSEEDDDVPKRGSASTKHQAIIAMDMAKWKNIIERFDIQQPLIPHREEENLEGPGSRSWYN